jgi:HK97 family phage prohead protease
MTARLEHKAVEASTRVDSDRGEFAAIAAAYNVDRVKERIRFGAFEQTIARWQTSGKRVPVHWDHRGEAHNIIGSIDPGSMREIPGVGLFVEGKLDLEDSEVAREAWRSMRDDRVSLSFGYLTVKSGKRADGTRDLQELDLFEVSIVPHPANPQTRFLSLKAVAGRGVSTDAALRQQARALGIEPPLTRRQLRRRSDELALEHALGWQPPPKVTPEPAESVHRGAAAPGMGPAQARAADGRPRPRSHRGGTR